MKKIYALLTAIVLIVAGCMNSEEELTINADGSGIYRTNIDMSGMLAMLQMSFAMDTSAKSKEIQKFFERDFDSTISLRTFSDTAKNLTMEERQLIKEGTVHILNNRSKEQFMVGFNYPFKRPEDLEKIIAMQKDGKIYNPFDAMSTGEDNTASIDKATGNIGELRFRKGVIERVVVKDADSENDELKELEQMGDMLKEIKFSTVLKLPNKVKLAEGKRISVSDDKRVVTVEFNMLDMMKEPESVQFRVEY